MPAYTFHSLSPHDFEILVRDLLQKELDVRLESFTSGRDDGIDLRYSKDEQCCVVIQCKHFARSTWSAVRRAIASEVEKVRALEPKRYILATSAPLTPRRKNDLLALLTPYCRDPADILGLDDINNLLSRHPDVERHHHKLWLTSLAVLERVLHAAIFAEQEADREHLNRRLSRFVHNPSVGRALDVLTEHHFCVITGTPGIGKTTLAEMLIVNYLDRGYECFRIWEDVREARAVFNRNKKQLFYYDDFLGKTGLRQAFTKNEDERLLRFLNEVASGKKTRLVLTTREYILNQARWIMEALCSDELELARCVIDLSDYTPLIRAHILYNHLYYSNVPAAHLEALLNDRTYRAIARHPNYNPRIVEAMTDLLRVRNIPPRSYPSEFLNALNNPQRIWEVAFAGHLTSAAQDALLVMTTLSDRVSFEQAERAFEPFHTLRVTRYAQHGTPYDWQRAVKELEGTFLITDSSGREILLEFHNPSIRDFLESRLRANNRDVTELISTSVLSSQIEQIWLLLRGEDGTVPTTFRRLLLRRYVELFEAPSPARIDSSYFKTEEHPWVFMRDSPLRRFIVLCGIARGETTEIHLIEQAADMVMRHIRQEELYLGQLTALIERIINGEAPGIDREHRLYHLALETAFGYLDLSTITTDDFDALSLLVENHPDVVDEPSIEKLHATFAEFSVSEEDSIRDELDQESRLSYFEDLQRVATRLEVELRLSREELEEYNDDWMDDEDEGVHLRGNATSEGHISDGDLDALFESLRSSE